MFLPRTFHSTPHQHTSVTVATMSSSTVAGSDTPPSFIATPSKTPSSKASSRRSQAESKSRFEAYNRLQAAAVAFSETMSIPEIVAVGGQSDGKSSLLEALLGFRFNVREVEMGTRRPLILQMVHDASALEPRCRFQVFNFPTLFL